MWDSFEVIGAEQVDGQNLLAWKFYDSYSDSYNYETWEMSSDWSEWIESNWIEGGSKAFNDLESNFNQDINADGQIGVTRQFKESNNSFNNFENIGSTSLLTDKSGYLYAQTGESDSPSAIYAWGIQAIPCGIALRSLEQNKLMDRIF